MHVCVMHPSSGFAWVVFAALTVTTMASCTDSRDVKTITFHPQLAMTIERLLADTNAVPQYRQTELNALAQWTAETLHRQGRVDLIFICTHNSRRSHLAQVWAQVGSSVMGLSGIQTFSGGTEATACNPRTVEAMRRAGFEVTEADTTHGTTNPTYHVSTGLSSMFCFSKKYGDEANPKEGFAAVMTCSSADRSCPLVYGAEARFSTPYVDPKVSDGTLEEAATYDARLDQIGTEMLYLMGRVAERVTR